MKKELTARRREELLTVLRDRFCENMNRHEGVKWEEVQVKLEGSEGKLWTLSEMETSGGEPDVIAYNESKGEVVFCDCSAESPVGRRNLCYDNAALEARKKFKPKGSVLDRAKDIGAELLSEREYRELQKLGEFDMKTSSWIRTPDAIRTLGGALFCDRRYDTVFVYHNGAQFYYGSRGFRCKVIV